MPDVLLSSIQLKNSDAFNEFVVKMSKEPFVEHQEVEEEPPPSTEYSDVLLSAIDLPKVDSLGDFIDHHGVKGMKWGVRKAAPAPSGGGGGSSGSAKPDPLKPHEDFLTSRIHKSQGTVSLSNAELKKLNERLQLEKKYSELTPTTVARGHNKVKAIMAIVGTAVAVIELYNKPYIKPWANRVLGIKPKSKVEIPAWRSHPSFDVKWTPDLPVKYKL